MPSSVISNPERAIFLISREYLNVNLGNLMLTLRLESTKPGNSRVMLLYLSSSLAFCARYFCLTWVVPRPPPKFCFSSQQREFKTEPAFSGSGLLALQLQYGFFSPLTMYNYRGLVICFSTRGVKLIMIG